MPFRSKKQMKACYASNGFNGKVDCDEWAKATPNTKSLPESAKRGGCMECGGLMMQSGGPMPKQNDYPDYESWQSAVQDWMAANSPEQSIPNINIGMMMGDTSLAPPDSNQLQAAPPSPAQDAINKGIIRDPEYYHSGPGANQQYPPKKTNNPYQTLQNIGLGLKTFRTALGEISGHVERGRQNQYDYKQLSALGQMNPMPTNDFQPNPYNLYMQYGGNLNTIMKDYNQYSNDAQFDFGSGDNDQGMMKKGGYEIDRMLVLRKFLPELLKFGRLGTGKYRTYKKGGMTQHQHMQMMHDQMMHDQMMNPHYQQGGLNLYTQSNTPQGGITPTGKSNAATMSQDQIRQLAKQFGFRTDTNANLQQDLFDYAQKNQPSAYQNVLGTYGQTAAGDFVDNQLGARTSDLLQALGAPPQQNIPGPQPFQAQAKLTENLYDPRRILYGRASQKYRDSQGITDPGVVAPEYVDFQQFTPNTTNFTGPRYKIPYDAYTNQITHGTTTVQNPDELAPYMILPDQARQMILNKNPNAQTMNVAGKAYGGYNSPYRQMKKGGKHWIQGAINPAHKGYCTPMSKSTCTPRRKALARTFKKHHGFHQDGGFSI